MIDSINHVGIRVRDMAASKAFYVDILGLASSRRKQNWLMLPNGQAIHLMPATDASNEGRDIGDLARHIALRVESLEATTALLIGHGLKPFQASLPAPGQARFDRRHLHDVHDLSFGIGTVFVEDPDGNIVEFMESGRGIFAEIGL